MRIAYLGTPDFAIPPLAMLLKEGHTIEVYTQPDKPKGRHAAPIPPPVKAYALKQGIPVRQFTSISATEGVAALRAFMPDLLVTAAFGQILTREVLDIAPHGCINVHGSLLPKYRGAAPIQWAIINGERQTGITTMLTDEGLDTGDILLQRAIEILPDETAGELYERLCALGSEVLRDTIAALENGTLTRVKQDSANATKCCMLKKEHGKLDFQDSAQTLHNRVRGLNPWPGAYAMLDGKPLKIWLTRMCEQDAPAPMPPGLCFGDARTGLFVMAADRPLEIVELQTAGGKRMDAKAYLCGRPLAGVRLE